jgi:hypothetical protein
LPDNELTHAQGVVHPANIVAAFERLGPHSVVRETLVQFSRQVAGRDGLVSIHDMCVMQLCATFCWNDCFRSRRAVVVDSGAEPKSCDWEAAQRQLLMQHLRCEGRNLKGFWKDTLRRSCGGGATAKHCQNCVDELVPQQASFCMTGPGVILAAFLDSDYVLTFDDFYDALVCT